MQNGKEVVNRLLRKPPKLRNRPVQPEVNRELKLKNIRRRIEKYKGIIADEQKKIDLLNISTSPRTKKSVQYHKNKVTLTQIEQLTEDSTLTVRN